MEGIDIFTMLFYNSKIECVSLFVFLKFLSSAFWNFYDAYPVYDFMCIHKNFILFEVIENCIVFNVSFCMFIVSI